MFSNIGKLNEYWHVIALERELRPGHSIKRKLYGVPLLIWRDHRGQVFAIQDCCAHRRAPLQVKDFSTNQIVCPYHGWEYSSRGQLLNVPSDSLATDKLKCSVPSYPTIEESGFIWLFPNSNDVPPLSPRPDLSNYRTWTSNFKSQEFRTSVDLLVDNFMDPTHTALVHDGLIRKSSQIAEHEMLVLTNDSGVKVEYKEQIEQVGLGMRFLFGKTMRTQHSDEFLAPNLVRVIYRLNGIERFVALIACTPNIQAGQAKDARTLALVQLRYNFGKLTFLLKPFISWLAGKVLKQDLEITENQWANQQVFTQQKEHHVAADAVAARVTRFRKQLMAGQLPTESSEQLLKLNF